MARRLSQAAETSGQNRAERRRAKGRRPAGEPFCAALAVVSVWCQKINLDPVLRTLVKNVRKLLFRPLHLTVNGPCRWDDPIGLHYILEHQVPRIQNHRKTTLLCPNDLVTVFRQYSSWIKIVTTRWYLFPGYLGSSYKTGNISVHEVLHYFFFNVGKCNILF